MNLGACTMSTCDAMHEETGPGIRDSEARDERDAVTNDIWKMSAN
jgi:hypothetical protein